MFKVENVSKIIKTMNTCDLATEVREHIIKKFEECQQNQFNHYNTTDEEMKLRNLIHKRNFKGYINSRSIKYKKARFSSFEKEVINSKAVGRNSLSKMLFRF